MTLTVGKLLIFISCALFVIAALVIDGLDWGPAWSFGFGGLAAGVLSFAFP
jgi:hypothetical protein